MGMYDDKVWLTGESGAFAKEGDRFFLHSANLGATVVVNGKPLREAILTVSRDGNDTQKVYTTGRALVSQIERMDDADRASMPHEVALETIPTKNGNAHVLRPVAQTGFSNR